MVDEILSTATSPREAVEKPEDLAVRVDGLCHNYGSRRALIDLSLSIHQGEIFAFLGPNGSGKTTLFRILSTLIRPSGGSVRMFDWELPRHTRQIRASIGVVFQAPSLDKKLTVAENVRYQAALYGMAGRQVQSRQADMLGQLGLTERAGDLVETLSGGLRRRVELAKGMIHRPRLLLLDEPSTGLDPGARSDLWVYLNDLRDRYGVTVVFTTHLLEEADKADRLAILNQGQLVALDTPDALRGTVGGDSITIESNRPQQLAAEIGRRFDCRAEVIDGSVRLEIPDGHQWITRLIEAFPGQIHSVTLSKPTLEDVFIDRTGHRFWRGKPEVSDE